MSDDNSLSYRIKKYFKDFSLTLASSLVSIGVIQLVVYPYFARLLDTSLYGKFLTIIGIVQIIVLSIGNSLGNTRLVNDFRYRTENVTGDFSQILLIALAFSSITISSILILLNLVEGLYEVVLIIVYVCLTISRTYLVVSFRLNLQFRRYFISFILLGLGNIIGLLLLAKGFSWISVLIVGETISIIYVVATSDFIKESIERTPLFRPTLRVYLLLVLSGFIGNASTYFDRLIIYPVLGATSVSIYFASSFFGKTLSFIVGPMSGLLLSYFAAGSIQITRRKSNQVIAFSLFVGLVFYVFALFLGPIVVGFFYPSLAPETGPFINIANAGAIVGIINALTSVLVLKYAPAYWQLVFGGVKLGSYLLLSAILMNKYGLIGFCYSVLISNVIILTLNILVTRFMVKETQLLV